MQVNSHLDSDKLDHDLFIKRLKAETELLREWFINKTFEDGNLEAGSEVEFLILDDNYLPTSRNLEFIKTINQPRLVPEVGAAQLEINSIPQALTGNCLTLMHDDLASLFRQVHALATQKTCHLALIGSMPVNQDVHLQESFMTNTKRLNVLNDYIYSKSINKGANLRLAGTQDKINLKSDSLWAICGLISSLQLHLKVNLDKSVRYYNAAQVIAGPMLALCANSAFFGGQALWSESRISLFEQIHVDNSNHGMPGIRTAIFGTSYLKDSFFDLFNQNNQQFPIIIPEICQEAPIESMFHMRGQNSLIYRWNRPILDFNSQGKPHLRIEHRGPSTGPTVVDMVANAAFFYGIMHYMATKPIPIEQEIPFYSVKKNFYNAARLGLSNVFTWINGQSINAYDLLNQLIPLARQGLTELGVTASDANYYLGIIQRRVDKRQNGSVWQQAFVSRYGKDFPALLEAYIENQSNEMPISDWSVGPCSRGVVSLNKHYIPINHPYLEPVNARQLPKA